MRFICFLLLVSLSAPSVAADHEHHHHGNEASKESGATAAPPSKTSLYGVLKPWTDDKGQKKEWSTLQGQPVLLAMAYTSCKFTCPLIVKKLKDIEKDLKAKNLGSYKIILASFDPQRDTPKKLASFKSKEKLSDDHWSLMTAGNSGQVRELAALLGINYQEMEGGDFSHPNTITLLNSAGEVVEQLQGLNQDHSGLVNKIAENQNGRKSTKK